MDTKSIVELREMLSQKSKKKRIEAACGLAEIGDPSGLNILLECLDDSKAKYKWQGLSGLFEIGDKINLEEQSVIKIAAMLKEKDERIRNNAFCILKELKHPASIPALIEGLSNEDISISCITIFEAIGKPSVPALIKVLSKSTDEDARWRAAMTLNILSEKSSVTALIKLLKDKNTLVQSHAAIALGKMKSKEAIPELMKAAKTHVGLAGVEAIEALGEIGDKTVLPFLLGMLKEDDTNIKVEVAEALGKIGEVSAVPHLDALTEDPDCRVRKEVKKSIELLKHPPLVTRDTKTA